VKVTKFLPALQVRLSRHKLQLNPIILLILSHTWVTRRGKRVNRYRAPPTFAHASTCSDDSFYSLFSFSSFRVSLQRRLPPLWVHLLSLFRLRNGLFQWDFVARVAVELWIPTEADFTSWLCYQWRQSGVSCGGRDRVRAAGSVCWSMFIPLPSGEVGNTIMVWGLWADKAW